MASPLQVLFFLGSGFVLIFIGVLSGVGDFKPIHSKHEDNLKSKFELPENIGSDFTVFNGSRANAFNERLSHYYKTQ